MCHWWTAPHASQNIFEWNISDWTDKMWAIQTPKENVHHRELFPGMQYSRTETPVLSDNLILYKKLHNYQHCCEIAALVFIKLFHPSEEIFVDYFRHKKKVLFTSLTKPNNEIAKYISFSMVLWWIAHLRCLSVAK